MTTSGDLNKTFHMCIKVNGQCEEGSLLTEALLQEFRDSDQPMVEFSSLANNVTSFIKMNQREKYITCFWLYKVIGTFHFWNRKSGKNILILRA